MRRKKVEDWWVKIPHDYAVSTELHVTKHNRLVTLWWPTFSRCRQDVAEQINTAVAKHCKKAVAQDITDAMLELIEDTFPGVLTDGYRIKVEQEKFTEMIERKARKS